MDEVAVWAGVLAIGLVAARHRVPLMVPVLLATALAPARWDPSRGIGALDSLHYGWTFSGIFGLSALSVGRTLAAGGRALPAGAWAAALAVGAVLLGHVNVLPALAFTLYWATDARDPDAGAALAAVGAWSAGRALAWPLLLFDHAWSGLAAPLVVAGALTVARPGPVWLAWAALGLVGAAPYTWVRDLPVGVTGDKLFIACGEYGCNASFGATWPEAAAGHARVEPWPADTSASTVLDAGDGKRLVFLHRDVSRSDLYCLGITEIGPDRSAPTVIDLRLSWTLAEVAATCEDRYQCTLRAR